MRYRKLTADGDYTFGNGQLDFYRDTPETVGQAVKTRILLWLGEWFLNTDEGTPFMLTVLGKHSKASADATIKERILTTQGVTEIESYESEIDAETRTLSINAVINTIYGATTIQISNYVNY